MESAEAKKQRSQRNRRRQRAARLQQQRQAAAASAKSAASSVAAAAAAAVAAAAAIVDDIAPVRRRPPLQTLKTRKKRQKESSNSSIYDEDIIDGFAILSFKTYEDLENTVKSMAKKMAGTEDKCSEVAMTALQKVTDTTTGPTTTESKTKTTTLKLHNNNNSDNATNNNTGNHLLHHHNKKLLSPGRNNIKIHNTHNDTGGASDDNVRTEDEINTIIALNGPQHSDSRDRLSDEVSSRPSSGRGYICDSESEDDRVSDTGSDLFTTAAPKREITSNHTGHSLFPSSRSNSPLEKYSGIAATLQNSTPNSSNSNSGHSFIGASVELGRSVQATTSQDFSLPPAATISTATATSTVTSTVSTNFIPHLTGLPNGPGTSPKSICPGTPPALTSSPSVLTVAATAVPPPTPVTSTTIIHNPLHFQHHHPYHNHYYFNNNRHSQSQQPQTGAILPVSLTPPTTAVMVTSVPVASSSSLPSLPSSLPSLPPSPPLSSRSRSPRTRPPTPHSASAARSSPLLRQTSSTPPLPAPSLSLTSSVANTSSIGATPTPSMTVATATTTVTASLTTPLVTARNHSPSATRDSQSYSSNVSSLSRSSVTPSSGSNSSANTTFTSIAFTSSLASLSFTKASTWASSSANPVLAAVPGIGGHPVGPHISPAPPPRPTPPPPPTQSQGQPPSAQSFGIPLHNSHQQHQQQHHSQSPFTHPSTQSPLHAHHGMFAPPIPPPSGANTGLPSLHGNNPSPFGADLLMPQGNQADLLRRELDNRFLASQDRSVSIPPPPYMRTEMHQHQHQHTHLHQHSHLIPPPLAGPLVPPSASHLFDKIPKLDSPFYRQTLGLPGYASLSPLITPSSAGATTTPFAPPNPLAAFQPKKSGRWCAMHVRIAWEIYNHQQKQQAEAHKSSAAAAAAAKTADLVRPPSHLFPSLHRPHHDLSSLIGPGSSHPRTPFDTSSPHHNSFLNPSAGHLALKTSSPFTAPGMSTFARPAYPGFNSSVGAFGGLGSLASGGMFGSARDLSSLAGLPSPAHEQWNRLHRTPSSFPTPPSGTWPMKTEADRERHQWEEHERENREREQEKEKEREREREREREKEREREREREREQREREQQRKAAAAAAAAAAAEAEKREKELERSRFREKEKERERELERQKERDREARAMQRSLHLSSSYHHQHHGGHHPGHHLIGSHHGAHHGHTTANGDDPPSIQVATAGSVPPTSRSSRPKDVHHRRDNSRSPLRNNSNNGSSNSAFDNILNSTNASIRVKDEPKKDAIDDSVMLIQGHQGSSNQMIGYNVNQTRAGNGGGVGGSSVSGSLHPHQQPQPGSILDRTRMPPTSIGPFGIERHPHPHPHAHPHHLSMWTDPFQNPYRSLDFHAHRMELEREHMLQRFNPLGQMMYSAAVARDRDAAAAAAAIAAHEYHQMERAKMAAAAAAIQYAPFATPQPPPMNPLARSKSNSPMNCNNVTTVPPTATSNLNPPLPPPLISSNNQNHVTGGGGGQRSRGNSPAAHVINKLSGGSSRSSPAVVVENDTKSSSSVAATAAGATTAVSKKESSGSISTVPNDLESQSR